MPSTVQRDVKNLGVSIHKAHFKHGIKTYSKKVQTKRSPANGTWKLWSSINAPLNSRLQDNPKSPTACCQFLFELDASTAIIRHP